MGVRNGLQFVDGLRAHPKDAWIAGRQVRDVTAAPELSRPVQSMAALYDMQTAPGLIETMTYSEPEAGQERFGLSFLVPRTREDLVRRRLAMQAWAEATFGLMGRSPDYLNTVLVAFLDSLAFFAAGGERFAGNVERYYRLCRDNDLFLTHAIVNPQIDRSKPSSAQAEPFLHLGVVEETREGLVVSGAKMLATHGPTADELLVYPLPGSLRPGEERYALAFGIPTDAPGLRFICREAFDDGRQSEWDHPLGARFEEPDAVAVFDNVLIPWERVFLHGDVARANTLFAQASIQNHTAHQTAIRGLVKCQFMTGLAIAMTRAVKTDGFLHVQESLGEIMGHLQLIEGAILLSEAKAEPTGHGTIRPAWEPVQALRYHIPKFYERMVQVTQVLGAGGLLINPAHADLTSERADDIARYYRGADLPAAERIRLFKLAWDATGTQFGQRQLQYERYYAGDPVRTAATLYMKQDAGPLIERIRRAMR